MFAWLRRLFGGGALANLGTRIAITGAARTLGYFVGKDGGDGVELAISSGYNLVRTGQLSPEAAAVALKHLNGMNPILYMSVVDVLQLMGAQVAPGPSTVALAGIAPEVWDLAHTAYMQGLALGRASRKG
jgi:hypothetical protein